MNNGQAEVQHLAIQVRDLVTGVPLQRVLQQDMHAYDRACYALDELDEWSVDTRPLSAVRELLTALQVDADTTTVEGETSVVVVQVALQVIAADLEERVNGIYRDGGATPMLPVLSGRAAHVDLQLLGSTAWDDPEDTMVAEDAAAA